MNGLKPGRNRTFKGFGSIDMKLIMYGPLEILERMISFILARKMNIIW
jgi:hypothetical protein